MKSFNKIRIKIKLKPNYNLIINTNLIPFEKNEKLKILICLTSKKVNNI